ncbi:MAG TPA: YihY/virulence factor BrkB family protein [Allosphingosinicella sp.]|jgi:membrane protein|nr:YihY/virulence factor BrkB family protein [Allosphingosinicella sp.]
MQRQGAAAPAETEETPADLPPRAWKDILLATWKEAGDDDLTLVSAGVAFYAFLAFVPLLTAFVLSYGLIAEPSSVVAHMQGLTSVLPQNAAEIIGDQLKSMTETGGGQKGFGLLLAIGIALYGATKGAAAIMTALNIAYDVRETRSFIARTAMSFAMTAGGLLTLFLAIVAVAGSNALESFLPALSGVTHILIKVLLWSLAAASVVLLLAIIYRYGPNRPNAPWRWITPGSAVAALAWLGATAGFGLYVSNFGNYNATYGSLGAVIVFLTWLYLSAYIVLLGAELNSEIERRAAEAAAARKRLADPAPATSPAQPQTLRAPAGAAPGMGEIAWKSVVYGTLLTLLGRRRTLGATR